MKCLLLDIETFGMNFNADRGFIMAISYRWKHEHPGVVHTITRKNPHLWSKGWWNDKPIIQQFLPVFQEADMIVTWNGEQFDLKYLQTRMLKHRLGYLPPVPHEDGLKTARNKLKMGRSLENVGKFFDLHTAKEKMPLETVWFPAAAGDPKALKQVIKRCETDVLLLEEAYELIGPLSKVHPNICIIDNLPNGCPFCGSRNLIRQGTRAALRHYRKRYRCKDCGHWSTSAPIMKKGA
jgi:uncharacterized protein YprB with RNaseH-like and TPR domain